MVLNFKIKRALPKHLKLNYSIILNPQNNFKFLKLKSEKKCGIYVWTSTIKQTRHIYVGRSVNL